jgi:DNA-binding CsgD family transcriptional regulator
MAGKRQSTPKKDAMIQREQQAWKLRSQGLLYVDIARRLHVSIAMVWKYLDKARTELRHDSREYASEERSRDLADIEFFRTKLLAQAKNPKKDLAKTSTAFATILTRKAKLLGIEAPTKTELSGAGGGPIISAGEGWEERLIVLGWTPPKGRAKEVLPGLPMPGSNVNDASGVKTKVIEVKE